MHDIRRCVIVHISWNHQIQVNAGEGVIHLPTGELRGGGSKERRVGAGVLGGWGGLRKGALGPSAGGDVMTRWGGASSFTLLGPKIKSQEIMSETHKIEMFK